MLKSIQFKNFKILRDATLPLERFTLIVGPNSSGKSTALQALQIISNAPSDIPSFQKVATAELRLKKGTAVQVLLNFDAPYETVSINATWSPINEMLRKSSKSNLDTDFVLG